MTEYDTKRATGRTTGLILQSLGKAVENPGTEIEFVDHYRQNHTQLRYYKERIENIAKQLNLDVSANVKWKENPVDFGLYVKSNWVSPFAKRTPAEEAFKDNYGAYPDELKSIDEHKYWVFFKRGFEVAQ